LYNFDQCRYSAPWPKPSTIASNDPGFATIKRFCNHGRGKHSLLAGAHAVGSWRTTIAARYPADLCEAIATRFVDWWSRGTRPNPVLNAKFDGFLDRLFPEDMPPRPADIDKLQQ